MCVPVSVKPIAKIGDSRTQIDRAQGGTKRCHVCVCLHATTFKTIKGFTSILRSVSSQSGLRTDFVKSVLLNMKEDSVRFNIFISAKLHLRVSF